MHIRNHKMHPHRYAGLNAFLLAETKIVFAGTFILVAVIELIFKSSVIHSHAAFLDDLFYFERSINGLTFNFLDATPADTPTGLGADYTPNLKLYRWLATLTGDIETLRLVHLVVFCFDSALLSLILLPLLRDRLLTVLTATFACVTPFSHILIIFANGTYFAWFFLFYFCAVLAYRKISLAGTPALKDWALLALGSTFGLLAASLIDSGILLLFPLLVFLGWNSLAWRSRVGLITMGTLALLLTLYSWYAIGSIQHPYSNMPGRLNYSPGGMVESGLAVLSHMIWRYFEPMQYTGFPLKRDDVYPAIGLILFMSGIIGFAYWKTREAFIGRLSKPGILPTLGFFLMAILVSIGPYTIQTVTHIWHYFPHMIFFVPSVILLLTLILHRAAGYAVIVLCAALTLSAYATTMPNYHTTVERQARIADFILAHEREIEESDRLVVITDTWELASGLMTAHRFTSFTRAVTEQPFLPRIEVYRQTSRSKRKPTPLPDLTGATVITMKDEFNTITITRGDN